MKSNEQIPEQGQDNEAIIDALVRNDEEALEKAGGKFVKGGLSKEDVFYDSREREARENKTKSGKRAEAQPTKESGYIDTMENPEDISVETIIRYLRSVNLAKNSALRAEWYEQAIDELQNGNPAEVIAILQEDLNNELDMSEMTVPKELVHKDALVNIEFHKREVEKLRKYIDFLKRIAPQA